MNSIYIEPKFDPVSSKQVLPFLLPLYSVVRKGSSVMTNLLRLAYKLSSTSRLLCCETHTCVCVCLCVQITISPQLPPSTLLHVSINFYQLEYEDPTLVYPQTIPTYYPVMQSLRTGNIPIPNHEQKQHNQRDSCNKSSTAGQYYRRQKLTSITPVSVTQSWTWY